jgi:hypothetical protein
MMSEPASTADDVSSQSEYSATDPGNDSMRTTDQSPDRDNVLAQLQAENGIKNTSQSRVAESTDDTNDDDAAAEPANDAPADNEDIPDELIGRALDAGLTANELREFNSAKELRRAVTVIERAMAIAERGKADGAASKTNVEASKTPDFEKMLADGHDADLIEAFRTTWNEAKAAREQAQAVVATEQQRAFELQCQRFDETLDSLPGYEAVFGKGRFADLAQKDPTQATNRQRVFSQMEVLRRGYEATGQPVPNETTLIRSAAASVFSDQSAKSARQVVKKEIEQAGKQAIAKAGSGPRKALSGPSLAAQKEAEFWRKFSE